MCTFRHFRHPADEQLITTIRYLQEKQSSIVRPLPKMRQVERWSVTSGYHGSKMSGSQSSFLTETAICIVERWKKSMGYCFVPKGNHAQESHACQFFSFFSAIFAGPRFVKIKIFCYHGNVT